MYKFKEDAINSRKRYYRENKEAIRESRRSAYFKKKEKGVMVNTCAKTVPDWLLNLPPGKYTIKDIMWETDQKYNNIYLRLNKLDVERIDAPNNRINFLYIWEGAEYYIKKFLKERLK